MLEGRFKKKYPGIGYASKNMDLLDDWVQSGAEAIKRSTETDSFNTGIIETGPREAQVEHQKQ